MKKRAELQKDLFAEELIEVSTVVEKNIVWEVTYAEPRLVYIVGKNEEDVREKLDPDPRFTEIAMRKHVVAPLNLVTRREVHRRKYSTC